MIALSHNIDLTSYTTFRLPVRAAHYCELTDVAQLPEICRLPQFDRETVLWMGGGSNMVFVRDYPALVVRMTNKGIRECDRKNGFVYIEAQAGEVWHDFVRHCIEQGWYGLENLSLIPGTVGAAPVQNIGAYGIEVGERIEAVNCFDLNTQTFVRLNHGECRFAYRESLFKQEGKKRYVIVSVEFRLPETFEAGIRYGDVAIVLKQCCGNREPTAADVSDAICQIRRSKLPDPAELGNVGSFYKNPIITAEQAQQLLAEYPEMPHYPQADGSVKLAAGWLIEQCGLKGRQIGGAAVHEKQALVLINRQNASADDVIRLSEQICREIEQKFQVRLVPEPNWLPE